ncbi:hypothetical protein [Niallia circulans]|uniref:hypothetical protein n=1 Tax=Niallia circulans TaxID=1397 RepID=UPI00155FC776|nr:hypothetical protein [Niallia circulans]NRG31128.1 hypothetical protein [Niallia circulans]
MKKAVIFGVYQFVGFHICSALLEEGEEIIGISYPEVSIEDLEDKRMEIGRNANFSEKSLDKLPFILQDSNVQHIYFDLYTIKKISIYEKIQNLFSNFRDIEKSCGKKLIFLVNITSIEAERDFTTFLKDNLVDLDIQVIHLPTLYGPWQPSDFLFQQIVEGKEKNDIQLNVREYTMDAIFIEDAVREVVKMTTKGQNNDILLKSKEINHWQRCLEQLQWDIPKTKKDLQLSRNLQEVIIENKGKIEDNIEKQKKHYVFNRI